MTEYTFLSGKYSYIGKYIDQILNETDRIYKAYRKAIGIEGDDLPTEFNYPKEGPITSTKDEVIIRSLIDGKKFLILNTNNTVYTLGLWLLYGLPELVIDISKITPSHSDDTDDLDDLDDLDAKNNSNAAERFTALDSRIQRIVTTYVHNLMPTIHHRLEESKKGIYMRRFYDQKDIDLIVNKDLTDLPSMSTDDGTETVRLRLSRVPEEEYIGLNADYMIWFYSYYMRADTDRNIIVSKEDSKVIEKHDGLEYQIYPIYRTTFKYDDFQDHNSVDKDSVIKTDNTVVNSNTTSYDVQDIVNKYIEHTYSDFSDDSFDELDSESSE